MILATMQPIDTSENSIAVCDGVVECDQKKRDWIFSEIYATTRQIKLGHSEKLLKVSDKNLCFVFHPIRDIFNRIRPVTIVWDKNTSEEEIEKTFARLEIPFSRYLELKKAFQKKQNNKKIFVFGLFFVLIIACYFFK
ncbi:hypothetical protein [Helicobacter pametensis]|uniref:hypothetical protein n=1 Tax=Helicobacter pametensis TaxID=95149 RepID=UPI000483FE1E|nr:hypothetical protein [Helicobacter pametensis]